MTKTRPMLFELTSYIMAVCLGIHSCFGEGMIFYRIGSALDNWALRPKNQKRLKLIQRASEMEQQEFEMAMLRVRLSHTWRQLLLKPLYSCVGCMSGLYGIAVFSLVCAVGGHRFPDFAERYWLDGVSAILLCVFLNRLAWAVWERLKPKSDG